MNHHLFMTTATAPGVAAQPRMKVYRWRTYQFGREMVLVCENPLTGKIRVSTPIAHWDRASGQAMTDSGRVYELDGDQADDNVEFSLALACTGLSSGS